jgi:uncharacterized protein YndB with AHSA1/START domain
MIKKIAVVLGALLAILLVVIAIQPSHFAVERATEIAAPPDVVFAHLDSPRALDVWSPWVKMDPKLKMEYSGPESGVGASESWEGPAMGVGSLTVTDVKPSEEVELRLEFKKPMAATNVARFTLTPAGDATRVAWRMEGENNFVGKAASLVTNMDKMVGGTFESGLAELKTLAEADAKERAEQAAAAQAAEGAAPEMTLEQMKAVIGEPPEDPNALAEPATPPAD